MKNPQAVPSQEVETCRARLYIPWENLKMVEMPKIFAVVGVLLTMKDMELEL